jgi:hypothetical protein
MADLASDRRFNLAVGRYVLGHQGDQVSFIQDAASCLVSGGTLAFLDVDTDLRAPMYAIPHVPLFEDAVAAANEVWAAMGARINPGSRYHELFFKAGLREPMVIVGRDARHRANYGECNGGVYWRCQEFEERPTGKRLARTSTTSLK